MRGIAAHFRQRFEITLGLDLFRDRDHVQSVGEFDDAAAFKMPMRASEQPSTLLRSIFNSLNGSFCACSSVA